MKICIVTPAPPRSRKGNRITAIRWSNILTSLGHRVRILQQYDRQRCDLLITLHARRSYSSIKRFATLHAEKPLLVALTGTDLYGSIKTNKQAQQSLELATHLIVLQPNGIKALPKSIRHKAMVIIQSVKQPVGACVKRKNVFDVCVVGHLRPVKDPFRTARAVRLLPAKSRVRVLHIGAALSESMANRAEMESMKNTRYRWVGDWSHAKTLQRMRQSKLLVLTSKMEGGANVICEALAMKVPVISSRIDGSIGLLGRDYSGYFPVGDTKALAKLILRAETSPDYYQQLQKQCRKLTPLVHPKEERRRWASLLRSL